MSGEGALYILTDRELILPETNDVNIREIAKTVLLEEYEKLEVIFPDIELRIA